MDRIGPPLLNKNQILPGSSTCTDIYPAGVQFGTHPRDQSRLGPSQVMIMENAGKYGLTDFMNLRQSTYMSKVEERE